MASFVDEMVEMGFDREQSQKALTATGNTSIDAAITFMFDAAAAPSAPPTDVQPKPEKMDTGGSECVLLDGADQPTEDEQPKQKAEAGSSSKSESECVLLDGTEQTPAVATGGEAAAEVVAAGIKCLDCNYICANTDKAALHAERTGHTNFTETTEQPKQITPEEIAAKRQELEELIKKKRIANIEKDRKEAIEMEKKRRAQGQELVAAKQRLAEQEMKEVAEARKREKREAALAKQKILDEIKRDRERKKQEQSGVKPAEPVVQAPVAPVASNASSSNATECKIQFRFTNCAALKQVVQSFQPQEPLSHVRLFAYTQWKTANEFDSEPIEKIQLMTTFPKKVFSAEEMETPVSELGLMPSAVLHVHFDNKGTR